MSEEQYPEVKIVRDYGKKDDLAIPDEAKHPGFDQRWVRKDKTRWPQANHEGWQRVKTEKDSAPEHFDIALCERPIEKGNEHRACLRSRAGNDNSPHDEGLTDEKEAREAALSSRVSVRMKDNPLPKKE